MQISSTQPLKVSKEDKLKAKNLLLYSSKNVFGRLPGPFHSKKSGTFTEFKEHKEYIKGDDPKHIDWKAAAKSKKPLIKKFDDENNLEITVLLDLSASMNAQPFNADKNHSDPKRQLQIKENNFSLETKLEWGKYFSSLICFNSLANNNSTRLVLGNNQVSLKKSTPTHLDYLTQKLTLAESEGHLDFFESENKLLSKLNAPSLVFIISDFWKPLEKIKPFINKLLARGHQVIINHLTYQYEILFEFNENREFINLEDTNQRLNISPLKLAKKYQETIQAFLQDFKLFCNSKGVFYQLIECENPPIDELIKSFAQLEFWNSIR